MIPSLASAQQAPTAAGTFTPGHALRALTPSGTVFGDAGAAAGSQTPGAGYLTELGITNTGTPVCINDALINAAGGYHELCLGANSLGGGLISFNPFAGAVATNLQFNINGVTYPFPAGGGNVSGPASGVVVPDLAVWNSSPAGSLLRNTGPAQLRDSHTAGITSAFSSLQSLTDGVTTPQILLGNGTASQNAQAISGVANANTGTGGTGITNVIGVSGYVTDNVPNWTNGGANAVGLYGWALTTHAGANAWGMNTVCTTSPGLTGQACENELDLNYASSSDIGNGLIVTGASTAQPTTANAFSVSLLSQQHPGLALWTDGFFTQSGCCTQGAEFGQMATGTSQNSQDVVFDFADSVAQKYVLQATPTSFNFSGTQAVPNFQFGGNLTIATTFGLRLGTQAAIALNTAATTMTFGSGAGLTDIVIGNGVATLELTAIANGGTATKYVCVDGNNKVVIQVAAC